MTATNLNPRQPELDEALRQRILVHTSAINGNLLARLAIVSDDLDQGHHLAAIGGLDGLEHEIERMRNFLLLLQQPERNRSFTTQHTPYKEVL